MAVIMDGIVMQRVAVAVKQSERETGDVCKQGAIGPGQKRCAVGDG